MPGIGVVFNPRSRRNLRDPQAATRLARALGDHGVVREARSVDELHVIAEDFKQLSIDVLGISGGDGTNHVTITGFLDVYGARALPHLAFLRGGTMNTVANSVGVDKGVPEGLLGRLMRAYAQRASRPLANVERHVMKIGDARSSHYGFLFGTGVVYGFLAEYYANGEPSPLIAARTLIRGIGSTIVQGAMIQRMARPFRGSATLIEHGRTIAWEEHDYLAIAAGTIDHIGLNFRPFHRYGEHPGTFHALGIHASPLQFVRELPRIWRAEAMRPGRAEGATASQMVVRSADGTVRYMIDGDLHEKRGEIKVTVGPRVKIIVGT
jgi:diacylglycerol kinase family enzyme